MHESGVSPVVGVMLMLSVTVMIAAVVSTYAGGFGSVPEKTPQSSISARADLNNHPYPRIYFEHNGGDPILLDQIQVTFRYGENTTTVKKADTGVTCSNFTLIGSGGAGSENTIKAGSVFYLDGLNYLNPAATDNSRIRFGNTGFSKDQAVTWIIVDSRSSKAVSRGVLYL
jgi:FlaG/FlaF family flagellin (archaellin)